MPWSRANDPEKKKKRRTSARRLPVSIRINRPVRRKSVASKREEKKEIDAMDAPRMNSLRKEGNSSVLERSHHLLALEKSLSIRPRGKKKKGGVCNDPTFTSEEKEVRDNHI